MQVILMKCNGVVITLDTIYNIIIFSCVQLRFQSKVIIENTRG